MGKEVELRRHTASDGDRLTAEGVRAAVAIGATISGGYSLLVSSGAQRATQTLACFIAGLGQKLECGVTVNTGFRSDIEERWFRAAHQAEGGDLNDFTVVDEELVRTESARLGEALRQVFESLPEGGRALVVGHSPMHEAAIYGLTGEIVAPISKGAGVLVRQKDGGYEVEALT